MRKMRGLIPVLLLCLLLAGCEKKQADIVLMDHFRYTQDEDVYAQFEDALQAWQASHPDISVAERSTHFPNEVSALAKLGPDHLPDVFVADCLTGRLLADAGLVADLSAHTDCETFTYLGKTYAFPVLDAAFSALVVDPDAWDPGSDRGVGRHDGVSAFRSLLSAAMGDARGQSMLRHMIAGDREAAFTDDFFVERLEALQATLPRYCDPEKSVDKAIADFANGKCVAVLATGEQVYQLLEAVKKKNPALYKRLAFASPDGGRIPFDFANGLFINAALSDDPEKLARCVDLCRSLSALSVVRGDDGTFDRLNAFLDEGTKVPMWELYFSVPFWSAADDCLAPPEEDEKTVRECAAALQDDYEQYYLDLDDYSKKLDQFRSPFS